MLLLFLKDIKTWKGLCEKFLQENKTKVEKMQRRGERQTCCVSNYVINQWERTINCGSQRKRRGQISRGGFKWFQTSAYSVLYLCFLHFISSFKAIGRLVSIQCEVMQSQFDNSLETSLQLPCLRSLIASANV